MARTAGTRKKTAAHAAVGRIKTRVGDQALVERRRAQITKAASTTFVRRGFHACTIRDVAIEAGVSIGLIYQYVENKEDLLFLALVDSLVAYKEKIATENRDVRNALEHLEGVAWDYCAIHRDSPDTALLAYRETASLSRSRRRIIKELEVQTNQILIDAIKSCISKGLLREDIDVDVLCYQIVMLSHAWSLKGWFFRSRMSWEDYVRSGLSSLMVGVMTPAGKRQWPKR